VTYPPRSYGDPDSMLLSASWQCPVCNQRGDLHERNCFVTEAAQKIRELREANYLLMETNGRLRERLADRPGVTERSLSKLGVLAERAHLVPLRWACFALADVLWRSQSRGDS
jgi:hypothetical protein